MSYTKKCNVCGIIKTLDAFYNEKENKDGKRSQCKECKKEYNEKYHKEHREETREYYEETGRQKYGHQSMCENKMCGSYLGIVIGERLVRHLFKDVEVMPYGNTGFDFICNKGKKIDVKSVSTTINNGFSRWKFTIDYNTIADFFILVAFDNRTDLNPLHLWMIPGKEINHRGSKSISLSKIHKWDKWKMDIKDAQLCCTELRLKTH